VFLLLSLLASAVPDIRKIFFRFMNENSCSHKYMLQNFKHIWRTNWITSGHETTVSHRRSCWTDKNYMSKFSGVSALYSETNCIKTVSGESVFIRS
jgi:hypothetical protein